MSESSKEPGTSSRKAAAPRAKKAAPQPVPAVAANEAVPLEEDGNGPPWLLRLFVAGQSPKSLLAYANLKKICETYLPGNYRIELVDLVKEPHLAQAHQIVAVPTLIRQIPEPVKRVIGDLSNHERALVGMDLNLG